MDDYAYINARVRARAGRLFDRARYDMLSTVASTPELVTRLLDSPYAVELARVTGPSTGDAHRDASTRLEEAFRRELTSSLAKIKQMMTGHPRALVDVILRRWDVHNLKTVLRGKRAQATSKDVLSATFPVGELDEVALAEIVRMRTDREIADTLTTWRSPLARPLAEGLSATGQAEALQPVELALDRFVFIWGFRMVHDADDNAGTVRDYLRFLLDRTNLLTALRCLEERTALSPIEAARHFLDGGGRFTGRAFHSVVSARDLRQGLSLLVETLYAWLARSFPEGAPISAARIEQVLDRAVVRQTQRLARRDPLGIGVGIAYIEQKAREIRNLRMITRGKAAGIGAELIEEWLSI
jgi:V/A-type H+-transporting ATPase subunit C